MKTKLALLLPLIFISCTSSQDINYKLLKTRTNGANSGIIISCIRCSCIPPAIKQNKETLNNFPIFASKDCINSSDSIEFTHLSQNSLDSIYEKNYNMLLFKELKNSAYKIRIIKTEESYRLKDIINSFFDLNVSLK